MTAKEYLRTVKSMEDHKNRLMFEVVSLRQSQTQIRAIEYDKPSVQTSPRDTMSDAIIKLVDMERKVLREVEKCEAFKIKVIKQIHGLKDNTQQDVLYDRYILGLDFETIAEKHGYSYYRICHIHGDALREFTNLYLANSSK